MVQEVFYTEPNHVSDAHYHEIRAEDLLECIMHLISNPHHAADIVDAFVAALRTARALSAESNNKDLR